MVSAVGRGNTAIRYILTLLGCQPSRIGLKYDVSVSDREKSYLGFLFLFKKIEYLNLNIEISADDLSDQSMRDAEKHMPCKKMW